MKNIVRGENLNRYSRFGQKSLDISSKNEINRIKCIYNIFTTGQICKFIPFIFMTFIFISLTLM